MPPEKPMLREVLSAIYLLSFSALSEGHWRRDDIFLKGRSIILLLRCRRVYC